MRVVILHDRIPENAVPEQQDNLVQAREVGEALDRLGHEAVLRPLEEGLDETARAVKALGPNLVFNLVETLWKGGRWIHLAPAMLRRLGLPYTGASSKGVLWTTNKLTAKRIMRAAGLPTPDWITRSETRIEGRVPEAFIVKSVWEHASFHLDEDSVLALGPEAVRRELERREKDLGGEWFAEAYIDGREFNLALLAGPEGLEVLPPAEIIFQGYGEDKNRVVGYKAKWADGSYEYHNTPRSFDFPATDDDLLRRLAELCRRCGREFDLGSWARVDFRVDPGGEPWILEINTNPCLSSDAGYMAAAGRAGYEPADVIRRIVEAACASRNE